MLLIPLTVNPINRLTELLTLFHEYNPRLLTTRKLTQVIVCSNCGGSDFGSSHTNQDYRIIECKKCKNVRDLTSISEDVKHAIYHETAVEPDDKPETD